mmetsp:Transcript_53313/g.161918  ORF Transcript_53313/g.161918 Transcript_53313/m.161918 type:complete len:523 (+) Transcript_53313:146-1714(+)
MSHLLFFVVDHEADEGDYPQYRAHCPQREHGCVPSVDVAREHEPCIPVVLERLIKQVPVLQRLWHRCEVGLADVLVEEHGDTPPRVPDRVDANFVKVVGKVCRHLVGLPQYTAEDEAQERGHEGPQTDHVVRQPTTGHIPPAEGHVRDEAEGDGVDFHLHVRACHHIVHGREAEAEQDRVQDVDKVPPNEIRQPVQTMAALPPEGRQLGGVPKRLQGVHRHQEGDGYLSFEDAGRQPRWIAEDVAVHDAQKQCCKFNHEEEHHAQALRAPPHEGPADDDDPQLPPKARQGPVEIAPLLAGAEGPLLGELGRGLPRGLRVARVTRAVAAFIHLVLVLVLVLILYCLRLQARESHAAAGQRQQVVLELLVRDVALQMVVEAAAARGHVDALDDGLEDLVVGLHACAPSQELGEGRRVERRRDWTVHLLPTLQQARLDAFLFRLGGHAGRRVAGEVAGRPNRHGRRGLIFVIFLAHVHRAHFCLPLDKQPPGQLARRDAALRLDLSGHDVHDPIGWVLVGRHGEA